MARVPTDVRQRRSAALWDDVCLSAAANSVKEAGCLEQHRFELLATVDVLAVPFLGQLVGANLKTRLWHLAVPCLDLLDHYQQ